MNSKLGFVCLNQDRSKNLMRCSESAIQNPHILIQCWNFLASLILPALGPKFQFLATKLELDEISDAIFKIGNPRNLCFYILFGTFLSRVPKLVVRLSPPFEREESFPQKETRLCHLKIHFCPVKIRLCNREKTGGLICETPCMTLSNC